MRTVLILALLLILSSCAPRYLMPTPNMHASKDATDYTIVPAELRSSAVEIMYVTDRMPKTLEDGSFGYGHKRSSSLAFGHTTIEIGDDLSWPDLLAASVTQDRKQELPVDQQNITEIARFADTPLRVVLKEGVYQFAAEDIERQVQTTNKMNSYISDKLKILPQKDVILFVHGYNNSFEDASLTLAELWHFSGRQSLPILYSWPAGRGGLTGYAYDRESGEITIYHLKELLRRLARNDDIRAVKILAHSRGTDVTLSAIRELFVELPRDGTEFRRLYKISDLILAAPDIDTNIIQQRVATELIVNGIGQLTIYVSANDRALGLSQRLFGSVLRLGRLRASDLAPEQSERMAQYHNIHIIDSEGNSDTFGHGYFHTDPATSSDVIRVLNHGLPPGAENGRPLKSVGSNFWRIPKNYLKN
jgi:esterase/lipase superfamily enzyme